MTTTIQRNWRREMDPWSVSTLVLAVLILLPLVTVVIGLADTGPKWAHVASTLLKGYFLNTLILAVMVSVLCILFAVPTAWLVSTCDFPGRRVFEWALVMPLAIPTYVAGFVYFAHIEDAIPLQIWVRKNWGIDAFIWTENIIRYGLLSVLLASVLFPYLYISARASFSSQKRAAIEAARTLGRSPKSVFFTVALPLARPAIVAGLSLVLMEVINDYGAVHFFNVPTLTEGIFRTWTGHQDLSSALRLAGLVMLVVLVVLMIERAQRGGARFVEAAHEVAPLGRRKLSKVRSAGAILICLVPLTIGLLYPLYRLGSWAFLTLHEVISASYWGQLGHSLLLSLATASVVTAVAVLFAYTGRLHQGRWIRGVKRFSTVGYAAPGAVVALGVMVLFGYFDIRLGVMAIGFAYMVRFLTVAYEPVTAGMTRVCGHLDEASRVLGRPPLRTLFQVNLPMIRGTLLAATMLVFIDILKELPLTIILRPSNFETLSTKAFSLASEGRIHECAVPSLIIIIAGAIGVVVLNRFLSPKELLK